MSPRTPSASSHHKRQGHHADRGDHANHADQTSRTPSTATNTATNTATSSLTPSQLDARAAQLATSAPCNNPLCDQTCQWRRGKGRPALFCSAVCRATYQRQRQQLLIDIENFDAALRRIGAPTAETDRYTNARAQARWLLTRYGG